MYTLAARVLGSREDAADAVQDALVRAWLALPKFRGDARFSTWLYRIVVNSAHDVRAKRRDRLGRGAARPGRPARPLRRAGALGRAPARAERARRELSRRRRPLRRPRLLLRRDRRDDRGARGYGEVAHLPRAQRAGRAAGNTRGAKRSRTSDGREASQRDRAALLRRGGARRRRPPRRRRAPGRLPDVRGPGPPAGGGPRGAPLGSAARASRRAARRDPRVAAGAPRSVAALPAR